KAGLGMPMPAGVLRVYQQDSKGGTQFVGEDRIMHTPKDETLNVKIGNAFDVICERNQIDFQKIASNVYELEYEVTLRNHKAAAVQVEVNEPIGGTWRMINGAQHGCPPRNHRPPAVQVEVNEPIGGTWRMINASHAWTKTSAWAAQFKV